MDGAQMKRRGGPVLSMRSAASPKRGSPLREWSPVLQHASPEIRILAESQGAGSAAKCMIGARAPLRAGLVQASEALATRIFDCVAEHVSPRLYALLQCDRRIGKRI